MVGWEHSPHATRRADENQEEFGAMIGKLAGAWIGAKLAGPTEDAKGAILGAGAVALAKRLVPTVAVLALGGWAYKTWRDMRRAHPSYPAEATPRIPASETSSPS